MSDSLAPSAVRPALLGLSRDDLARELGPLAEPRFRVEQVYRAVNLRGVADFEAITDLPKDLRGALGARYRVGLPEVVRREPSGEGTVKHLLRLADGATVEAVDIPEGDRRTLCLSSQAGCALACSFCVTGYWGGGRSLDSGEIVGQVLAICRQRPASGRGLNLVFMGMGEPLLNLAALGKALAILTETVSWRRITVSTAGIVPGIDELARWPERPNLAVSLHAPDDERRSRIMPINRTYPLAELLAACERFPLAPGRKLTFEYLLIRGFNDQPADADATARLVRRLRAKVNLIPINPDPVLGREMVPPDDETVGRFQARLRGHGLVATVRRRRGDEVRAACGQLRAFGRDPRGFRRRA